MMRPAYTMMISSVNKKPDEEVASRVRRTRSTEKIIMVIFWKKSGILLREYLPGGTTISSPYSGSIIERFRCAMVEKHGGC